MKSFTKSLLIAGACLAFGCSVQAVTPTEEVLATANRAASAFNGNGFSAFYNELPADYQKKLGTLLTVIAEQSDKELWDAGQKALLNLSATAVKQAPYIIKMTDDGTTDAAELAEMQSYLVRAGGIVGGIVRAASFENVKAGNANAVFGTKALTMKGYTDKLQNLSFVFDAKADDDDEVELTLKDQPDFSVSFKKSASGKYLPEEIVEFFEEEYDEALAEIKKPGTKLNPEQKQLVLTVLNQVSSAAVDLGKAANFESFQQIVQEKTVPLMLSFTLLSNSLGITGEGRGDDED